MTDRLTVNEHYLNRVVAVAETAGVEAIEDIVSGSGIKLIAKGARIDARFKERLLQHKLSKPLESSVRIVGGVGSRSIDKIAEALLGKHALLAGVCGRATARSVVAALRTFRPSAPMESLLSVYAAQGPHKLDHAVGVSLLAAAMYHDLPDGGDKGLHTLMVAGLMHDVGELYIDPAILKPGTRLSPDQWKHIATHPIVADHLLRDMPGAGPRVAEAVLYHHERLDGFGYPHGLRGAHLPVSGQVLALAEMLMGLIESGRSPAERASIAIKLIPGEFNRLLLDRVAKATRACAIADSADASLGPSHTIENLAVNVSELRETLHRLHALRGDAQARTASGSLALRELIAHVIERCERIRLAFSSTGLDTHGPENLRECLSAMEPQVHFEVAIVLREIEWRLREVKREARLRAERLTAAEFSLVSDLVEHGKGRRQRLTMDEPAGHADAAIH